VKPATQKAREKAILEFLSWMQSFVEIYVYPSPLLATLVALIHQSDLRG
jgi:hypothetical protein